MVKKLKEEAKTKQTEWERVKKEFEDSLETKYTKGSVAYRVFFDKAWYDETQKNQFLQKIREEQKDLNDEIWEIKKSVDLDKKIKREEKSGKKEYDENDIKDSLKEASLLTERVSKQVPRTGNAKEILPQVTVDDYFLDTETTYLSILPKLEGNVFENYNKVKETWDDMKKSQKYNHHKSPLSSSEYLIDKKTGDVYRFSDHWGSRIASCSWYLSGGSGTGLDIAKSNIKDFERKETGIYFNPEYRKKMVKAANIVLPRLKKLVSENQNYYLTDKAKKAVLEVTDKIYNDLQWSAKLSIKEIDKLRKKYEMI